MSYPRRADCVGEDLLEYSIIPIIMPLIGCAICGKWSSPNSFPAGPGSDFPIKLVRGRGRGKGFDVVGVSSGLEDRGLALAVKEKFLAIAHVLAKKGYLSRGEMEEVMGIPDLVPDLESALSEARNWRSRASHLAKTEEDLKTELAGTKRLLTTSDENLRKMRSNESLLKVELAESRRRLSTAETEAGSLRRQMGQLQSELALVRDVSSFEGDQSGQEATSTPDYPQLLLNVTEAIGPVLGQVEYIALDDPELAEKLEVAQQAINQAREALAG